MRVLRWGRAEYEDGDLQGLGLDAVEVPGTEEAPLGEAEVLVVPSVRKVTAAHVARLGRCRLVLTTTSGFDHLDLPAVLSAGKLAARLPLARRDAVVETALGMMLALRRRLGPLQVAAGEGKWERDRLGTWRPSRLGRVAVVGMGVIGRRMGEALGALGAEVLPVDPRVRGTLPLDEALARADVVTLHCALNPTTRGLFDAARLATLRRGTVLVNTARGPLVDVDAAMALLRRGHLGGLGLDVFPKEPWPLANLVHPDVLVTPHAAGWHPDLWDDVRAGVVRAVGALERGEPVPFRIEDPAEA